MILTHTSVLALLGLFVSVGTVALSLAYAWKPRESLLVLMRPLSLAAIFGGLTACVVGLVAVLTGMSASHLESAGTWRGVAAGIAESLTSLCVAFGCLTIAWLLVTLGMRRGDELAATNSVPGEGAVASRPRADGARRSESSSDGERG
jgi:hypothetical protein